MFAIQTVPNNANIVYLFAKKKILTGVEKHGLDFADSILLSSWLLWKWYWRESKIPQSKCSRIENDMCLCVRECVVWCNFWWLVIRLVHKFRFAHDSKVNINKVRHFRRYTQHIDLGNDCVWCSRAAKSSFSK